MVPDPPSLTRRRLLGGVVGVAAGGTGAVGATEPTALPDALTDWATRAYPTPPEIDELWRPTVTEAHARGAVELLADTVSRGERLWTRLETDERFHGAGGWLESAREALRKGKYHEALFDATYGIQFAGDNLGFARAKLGLGEADPRRLAERGADLLARSRSVVDDTRPYPTVDPGRDLAWYYRVERELALGRLDVTWGEMRHTRDGVGDANGPDADEYDPPAVGGITSGLLRGEIRVRNAERFAERLSERLGGDGTPYADHLRDVAGSFRSDVESFPSRDAVLSRYVDETEDGPYGPYEFAHSRLARWCFDSDYRFADDESDDLIVYGAVELSKALAKRRAHGVAVDRLAVDPGDEGFDSGRTLAAKRRARATYRSVVGSDPPPLLTRQVRRAVEDLQVAKVGFGGRYQRPAWRERLKAYLYALVGRAKLERYPDLYREIADATAG